MATASQLLKLARQHVGETYELGALAPKGNPHWRGPWDCAEFTSWCVYQLTGSLFGCRPSTGNPDRADAYTGFWADDAKKQKCIVSVGLAAATPGAFVLRRPGSAIGHVAISVGDGSTIEAHSRRTGVITGNMAGRRWDIGILVPGITVNVPSAPMPIKVPGLVLRVKDPAMKGDLIRKVQKALAAAGFDPGPIDGLYGRQTAAAVRALQIQKGLAVDGEVGAKTARALGVGWD